MSVTNRTRVTLSAHQLRVIEAAIEKAQDCHYDWPAPTIEEIEDLRDVSVVVADAKRRIRKANRLANGLKG
jgi:hypothetical protein